MSKYFTINVLPDLINGDVSDMIGAQVPAATDAPFVDKDTLFDWTAFTIPRSGRLIGVTAIVNGEDGVAQTMKDIELVFAKSINGVAPTTIGKPNTTATTVGLARSIIGGVSIDKDTGVLGTDCITILQTIEGGADRNGSPCLVLHGETLNPQGTEQTIYVAGIVNGGELDFSTGVKPTAQATTSTDTIAVDGVDPRLCFSVGDTVYTNTDDTPLGTVKSLGANEIVLNANLAAQVEDNEEIVNANPIRLIFHFEL